jgi:hypothetical protein
MNKELIKKIKSMKYSKRVMDRMGYRDGFKAMGANHVLNELIDYLKPVDTKKSITVLRKELRDLKFQKTEALMQPGIKLSKFNAITEDYNADIKAYEDDITKLENEI